MIQGIRNKDYAKKQVFESKQIENHNYGTSKLEKEFANDFLDKYGIKYQYQFHAKDIGRYYDFYLTEHNVLLEIDGDYWHGNTEKFKKLNGIQKKAHNVDDIKNKWAHIHGIPIIRIWESDIRGNAPKVIQILKEYHLIELPTG